ncbi:MAG: response regulator [Deltaproteobacteria bacterium]|nr:response regulator [Deltaproteobacteria bacterium]
MKPTLIIVDDVEAIRGQLHNLLQEDFEILAEADDGRSAVECYFKFRPQLVLMDVFMPGMSGIEATRLIMKGAGQSPPSIVMLSGLQDEKWVLQALEAGATEYLFKPVEEEKLIKVLWKLSVGQKKTEPDS